MVLLLIASMAACTDISDDNNDIAPKNHTVNYSVNYMGVQIDVGVEAKDIISKLGDYTSEDGEACGTDEKDVIYTFSGIEIETHVSGSSEIVRKIEILNDSQKTEKGITIGSTRDEVIAAYGKNYTEGTGGSLRYEGDTSAIEFYFGTSGDVSNIYIKRK